MRTILSAVTILFAVSTGHAHALDLPKLNTYATAACEKALTLHEAGITNDTIYQVVLCAIALDLPKLNTYATAACEKALTLHEAGITNDTIYQVVLCAIWKQSDVI